MELSIPEGVSAIRGVARPERGLSIIDLVTIAPKSVKGKNWESSLPEPAQPEAVAIGLGSLDEPKRVEKSKLMRRRFLQEFFYGYPK